MCSATWNLTLDKWGVQDVTVLPYTPNSNRVERSVFASSDKRGSVCESFLDHVPAASLSTDVGRVVAPVCDT